MKPDDPEITDEIWSYVQSQFYRPSTDKAFYEFAAKMVTRIHQARSQAYEECAKIAEKERRTDLALKHGYKPSWHTISEEIAADIRQHSHKGGR